MTALAASPWTETVLAFVRENTHIAEPVIFALGFAESIALVSLFVPSSILFVAIGGLLSAAGGSFWSACLAGAAGAFLGDLVSYGFGRIFKEDVPRVWPFSRNPLWLPRAAAFFERWGLLGLVFGKFMGFLRPFLPVVAGTVRMPWVPFLIGSAVSSLLWAAVFLVPGYGVVWLAR